VSAVQIKITGQAGVNQKLVAILSRRQKALVDAVQETQALVVNDATLVVPVKTGFLRNSIKPGKVEVDARTGSAEGTVTADAEYASFVELGTSRQRAQPYMIPAVMKNRNVFNRLLKAAMNA